MPTGRNADLEATSSIVISHVLLKSAVMLTPYIFDGNSLFEVEDLGGSYFCAGSVFSSLSQGEFNLAFPSPTCYLVDKSSVPRAETTPRREGLYAFYKDGKICFARMKFSTYWQVFTGYSLMSWDQFVHEHMREELDWPLIAFLSNQIVF